MYYNYYPFYYYNNNLDRNTRENDILPTLGTKYIIEKDDNLYDIATRFNTTVPHLKNLNNLSNNQLSPGQIIIVDDKLSFENVENIYQEYIVQPEDSIYSLAFQFGMTAFELKDLNDKLTDEVTVGEVLTVKNNPEKLTSTITYTVKPGDNIYSIGKKHRMDIEQLMTMNNLLNHNLQIGQELIVFDASNQLHATDTTTYIVQPGDSIYSIAKRKNTTVNELKELNNLKDNILIIGEQLIVPK